ncbi:relaxase domain-containing protein [Streptomyces sp. NPDC048568]|uniref:relaxase domain-containing protein n=1 Tax=Streptomyces sp. NPDC048568 TaxID=3365571 RepID=UPI00372322E9
MISMSEVRPGNGWRYLFRGVMVGDGRRTAGTPLRAAQDEAGVPPGVWKGRGLAALGLTAGDVVTERQAELLLGEGRHPDRARAPGAGQDPGAGEAGDRAGQAHRAQPLAEDRQGQGGHPLAGLRPDVPAPPTAHIAWVLMDDRHRRVLELCNGIARDKTLAWLEDSVAEIRWKAGGKERDRVKDGLVVAVFQHYESRATDRVRCSTRTRSCRSAPGGRTTGSGETCRRTR